MEELIRFRMLASELSVDEYRIVINEIFDEHMVDFSSMIFNHFYHNLTSANKEQNALQITTVNDTISNIISQRTLNEEDDAENESELRPFHICGVADVLLQQIASFLPYECYVNFQNSCRTIFYAANSPSALYELDCDISTILSTICTNEPQQQSFIKRLERIHKLTVDQYDAQYSKVNFINLKEITLNVIAYDEVQQYVSTNVFDWKLVTHLDISTGMSSNEWFIELAQMIECCTNLTSLSLDELYDDDEVFSEHFANNVHDLKCLMLQPEACVNITVMLKNLCNTLQSLAVYPELHIANRNRLQFSNLLELCLFSAEPDDIILIIEKTKQLKRLLLLGINDTDDYSVSFEKAFEINTLEYFCIQHHLENDEEIVAFARSLTTSCHKKRDSLKLRIVFEDMILPNSQMYDVIASVWNTLWNWHTTSFMLIVEFSVPSKQNGKLTDEILNSFYVEDILEDNVKKVIISNKENLFNGYEEQTIAPAEWFLDALP